MPKSTPSPGEDKRRLPSETFETASFKFCTRKWTGKTWLKAGPKQKLGPHHLGYGPVFDIHPGADSISRSAGGGLRLRKET